MLSRLSRAAASTACHHGWRRGLHTSKALAADVKMLAAAVRGPGSRMSEGVAEIGNGKWAFSLSGFGDYSAKASVSDSDLVNLPADLPVEYAALAHSCCTGYHLFKKANLKAGDVLVQSGAEEPVGQVIVQLAKLHGVKTLNIVSDCPGLHEALEVIEGLGGTITVPQGYASTKEFQDFIADFPKASVGIAHIGKREARKEPVVGDNFENLRFGIPSNADADKVDTRGIEAMLPFLGGSKKVIGYTNAGDESLNAGSVAGATVEMTSLKKAIGGDKQAAERMVAEISNLLGRQVHVWVDLYDFAFLDRAKEGAPVRGIRTPVVLMDADKATFAQIDKADAPVQAELARRWNALSADEQEIVAQKKKSLFDFQI